MQKPTVNTIHDKDATFIDKENETPAISFSLFVLFSSSRPVFPNRRAAARYRALASIIPGRER
jgi:hypothetical protein